MDYNPRNWTLSPEMKIMAPAMACTYLSRRPNRIKLIPQDEAAMMVSMVSMVVKPKTDATKMTPDILCLAAGNMTNGISGSQGPSTNMVKSIQGVRLASFFFAWIWACPDS